MTKLIRALAFLTAVIVAGLFTKADAAPVDFGRDVRPILSRNCFKCHGPDEGARKAKLRLDERSGAMGSKAGEGVIVPGAPEGSELVARIFNDDPDEVMPPPSSKFVLTAEQKEILRRWIAEGAEYRPHWAFVAPVQIPPPPVNKKSWPRNTIDQFILARLELEGLGPSEEADRRRLVRRLHLDLIGLPPAPDEVEAFVRDRSTDAYERLVDRLLASPRYGERWARRWLDLARYADTNGYEKDRPRSMWPYRDWVIDAFNRDLPYNRFTIEQIAGDMLPGPAIQQQVATGFHRNTMINEEGGIDPLEFRFHSVVDRVATTGTTWLGLTLGCAQCHSHKFDPISHEEYYRFMAFLNNADEPELSLVQEETRARRRKAETRIEALVRGLADRWPVENTLWQTPAATGSTSSGAGLEAQEDRSVLVTGDVPERDTYTIELQTTQEKISELRIEALTDPKLPHQGPGRAENGNFVLSEVRAAALPVGGAGEPVALRFGKATADAAQKDFAAEKAIDGDSQTGWAVDVGGEWHVGRTLRLPLDPPLRTTGGAKLTVTLDQQFGGRHLLGRVRISVGEPVDDPRPEAERRAELVTRAYESWLARERARTVEWALLEPVSARAEVPYLSILSDHSVYASGDQTKSDTYDVRYRGDFRGVTGIRLEAMPDERLPLGGPGRVFYEGPKGEFFLSEFKAELDGRRLEFSQASESYARDSSQSFAAARALDGDEQSGWSTSGREGEGHQAVFNLAEPLASGGELAVKLLFERYYAAGLGRFRIWVTRDARKAEARDLPVEEDALPGLPRDRLTDEQLAQLRERFLMVTPELAAAQREIRNARRNLPANPTTLVLAERPAPNPRKTFVHHRGEFLQPGNPVTPDVPAVLPSLPPDAPRNRLALARWLVSPENPLTARVVVNRQWAAFFGRGLVRTTEDFGYQGELPSHPELLDWLAVEFMEKGWSLKALNRLIVTSATYRQDSKVTRENLERDPENRWLARAPRLRLEAELLRDTVLKVSGLLSTKMGGPSVFPPQPPGITTEGAYGPLEWKVSEGEDRYRRGLYTFMKRTTPYAMFATFDGPSGEACLARRDVSNTPLQALTLLNDAVVMDAARALGQMAIEQTGTTEARIARMFERCLARPPARFERRMLADYWQKLRNRLAAGELDPAPLAGERDGDPVERAAWTALARVLLNLDEFITRG